MLFYRIISIRQQFKYRVKRFLLIFLHGSIELVELYKTVYIEKILSHFSEITNIKRMFKNSFFHMEGKDSIFSIKLAFLITFTNIYHSKYTHSIQREKLRLRPCFEGSMLVKVMRKANFIEKIESFPSM